MKPRFERAKLVLLILFVAYLTPGRAGADVLVSANEGKYDLSSGVGRAVEKALPDSLTILDFAAFPPRVTHVTGISNSVIGPPTNVAVTPDERLALVANSVTRYTDDPQRPEVDHLVQVVDLKATPPRVTDRVRVGAQPSGMSINRAGDLALVANRGDGTVSVLSIAGDRVAVRDTITVGDSNSEPADVAINPAGTLAIVSLNKAAQVRVLEIKDGQVTVQPRKLPAYGQPYHVQITPDGALGLVAGGGNQKGPDADLLTVIDLSKSAPRTVDHFVVGTGPEAFDISPDGDLVAVVLMESSNVAADDPHRTKHGQLRLWKRSGNSFNKIQDLPIGRIPEGVCFTSDGRYPVVQEHAAKQMAIYEVVGGHLKDTGVRIATPGFPSALRRADRAR